MSRFIPMLLVTSLGCIGAPGYKGPIRPHFNGEEFSNLTPMPDKNFLDIIELFWLREPGVWDDWVDAPYGDPPPRRVKAGELRVTFVNHATTLIQIDGLNILTDPVWSHRVGPWGFLGPRRYRPPGIAFDDLPPIDVVLISHNHYDHLDANTLRQLHDRFSPIILAGLGSRALLGEYGLRKSQDLAWWQSATLQGVRITMVPAQHWSRRGFTDTRNTLWGGFVIEGTRGRAYFAGDTGWGPHFELIRERMGPVDLAILPVGAFKPRWFMNFAHISPSEAADAAVVLGAKVSVPVHWGTFPLGDDGQHDPPEILTSYLQTLSEQSRPLFWVLGFGEGRDVALDNLGAKNFNSVR